MLTFKTGSNTEIRDPTRHGICDMLCSLLFYCCTETRSTKEIFTPWDGNSNL